MATDHVVVRVRDDGQSIAEPVEGFQSRRALIIPAESRWEKISGVHAKGISNDKKTQGLIAGCFFCKCIGLQQRQRERAAEAFE